MAKNAGGHRDGAVKNRTQFQTPEGNWAKRNRENGQIMDVKQDGKPFKGVAQEVDDRRK